jgi:Kef-type K+ transport system membrane component KefB
VAPWFFGRYGDRVIEPEIKLVFAVLLVLMVLADLAHGHAVLPAFVLGLAMSRHFAEHREEQKRLRVVAFAFLTPFFFLKGGLNVSLGAVAANLGLLVVLLAAKMVPKVVFIFPLARRAAPREATFTTLLMSTGAHVRDDLGALWAQRRNHRPDAVLAARNRGGHLGDRPDRSRGALVPPGHDRRARRAADACPC